MTDGIGEIRDESVLLDLLGKKDAYIEKKEMIYNTSETKWPFLSNKELSFIIKSFPEPYKKKAWDILLGREPHNLCFCDVIANAENPYVDMSMEVLRKRGLCAIDFCHIIKCAEKEERKEKAWGFVVELTHEDSYCFLYLIDYAQQPYKDRALEEFLKWKFPIEDLKGLLCIRSGKVTPFGKEKIIPLLVCDI